MNKNKPDLSTSKRDGYINLRTLSASLDTTNYTVTDTAQDHTLDTKAGFVSITTTEPVFLKIGTTATTTDYDIHLEAGQHDFTVGEDTTAISLIRDGADSSTVRIVERAHI